MNQRFALRPVAFFVLTATIICFGLHRMDASGLLLTTVVCVVSVGVVRGTYHVPPKTAYYRNLCGCGLIFVVRASSNPEMGVEVNLCLANHRRKDARSLQFNTVVMQQCCNATMQPPW